MKAPEKLRQIAIQLHTMKVAEGLTSIEVRVEHHWRDAQDEPHSAPCTVKLAGDKLWITMTIDRTATTIYEGPATWLYGVRRYDDEEEA